MPERPRVLTEQPVRHAPTAAPSQHPVVNALQFPTGRINSNDANPIQHFVRWQTGAPDDAQVAGSRGIEGEHRDFMPAFDQPLRYSLQQSLDATYQRSVAGRNVKDAQRPDE